MPGSSPSTWTSDITAPDAVMSHSSQLLIPSPPTPRSRRLPNYSIQPHRVGRTEPDPVHEKLSAALAHLLGSRELVAPAELSLPKHGTPRQRAQSRPLCYGQGASTHEGFAFCFSNKTDLPCTCSRGTEKEEVSRCLGCLLPPPPRREQLPAGHAQENDLNLLLPLDVPCWAAEPRHRDLLLWLWKTAERGRACSLPSTADMAVRARPPPARPGMGRRGRWHWLFL